METTIILAPFAVGSLAFFVMLVMTLRATGVEPRVGRQ